MSHNTLKILNNKPDVNGNISLQFEQFSDVSISSIADGEIIGYNGSNLINTTKSESDLIDGYLLATENSTVSGVSSTYDTSSINSKFVDTRLSAGYGREQTLGGLSAINEFPSGVSSVSNIYCTFQLASGQFLLISSTRGHFSSSSSESVVCWMDSSYNELGNRVILQPPAGGMRGSRAIYGYINTNTNEKVHIGFVSTSGHLRRRTNRGYTIKIIKIGEYIS